MNRSYLLGSLREAREMLRVRKFKRTADDADQLLQNVLDAGMLWQTWVPRVHEFIALADQTLAGRRSLPRPTLRKL